MFFVFYCCRVMRVKRIIFNENNVNLNSKENTVWGRRAKTKLGILLAKQKVFLGALSWGIGFFWGIFFGKT